MRELFDPYIGVETHRLKTTACKKCGHDLKEFGSIFREEAQRQKWGVTVLCCRGYSIRTLNGSQ